MSLFNLRPALVLAACLSLISCASSNQGSSMVIVTAPPPPQEATGLPMGYTHCVTVAAAWQQGVWHPEHRVCQYGPKKTQAAQGNAFVEGYWACARYQPITRKRSECSNWSWTPGYWIKN
jgi:hypothetical protein